ncbi:type II secretion system F family protein [Rubinisphaera brasiliensis]|uniref:Type II secretion system F domain protein n=1 Tax=Rubinisphaera brasiliensis (strain ATCC 49424 / DSM 5305 / JCM 21570 / IAM 15109 / NBRC 103401 / IFAM 1448) TaxID=756272 RepID=F0SQ86_RUBBR|nr:type II secretion system F family protein [Rubinisphaera brasiliensis]ADY62265.1 Type II secretion system F domain protein [Rubinisphaera brasiliensis DSM 5305]
MAESLLNNSIALAQTGAQGTPFARMIVWLMFALVAILVVLLVIRLFRWIFGNKSASQPADSQPARTSPTPSPEPTPAPTAITRDDAPASTTSTASFSSVVDDDFDTVAAPSDRVRMTNRETITPQTPEYKVTEASSGRMDAPVPISASSESRAFAGKERSWTSRSLFGKPISGTQQDLPRVAPSEVPFRDTSDFQFGTATPALAAMLPESESRRDALKQELVEAGYYNPHAYENLAAVRYLGLMLPLLIFGVLLVFGPPQLEPVMLVLMIVGAVLGWSIPRLLVRQRAAKRRREIEQALPDVIDLLNMCVSQGMTLRPALARVSWEISDTYPAMAEELRIVAEQANLGTLEHALNNMNERVDVPELHSLTTLLIQTERMGTNVSDSLTEYSDGMRATLQQRADQKANAATFKLLFPTVLCLMPAVYFFLLGPAVVELSDFFESGGLDQYRQVDVDNPAFDE